MHNIELGEPHPQDQARTTRTFRDQHGRPWGGVCETKTGHWVQPLVPKFSAPYIPPSKYVVPVPGDGSEVFIDYQRLQQDSTEALRNYELRTYAIAQSEYRDDPEKALKSPTKWLRDAIGNAPEHPNIARACMAGNKWILGFSDRKPDWAYEYFPVIREEDEVLDLANEFPDVEDESESEVVLEYPHHQGGGVWLLSNQQKTKGGTSRAEAVEIEKAIAEFAGADA